MKTISINKVSSVRLILALSYLLVCCKSDTQTSKSAYIIALKNKPEEIIKIKAALQKIYLKDQQYRTDVTVFNKYYLSNDNKSVEPVQKSDSENLNYVLSLIDTYEWLPESIVGAEGSETMFFVVQHSNFKTMIKVLPLVYKAAIEGDVRKYECAYLYDRILTMILGKQLYGTQYYYTANNSIVRYPYIYPTFVNQLRQSVDMPSIESGISAL